MGAFRVQITCISAKCFLLDVRYWYGAVNINGRVVTLPACGRRYSGLDVNSCPKSKKVKLEVVPVKAMRACCGTAVYLYVFFISAFSQQTREKFYSLFHMYYLTL